MLFADFSAVQLKHVFGAADRISQRAIGVVQQRGAGEAPFFLVCARAAEAVRVQLATELVELVLQHAEIEVEARHESEDREIIASRRRLNLAALRAEKL